MAQNDGFLSRWSRRKAQARQAEAPAAPEPAALAPAPDAPATQAAAVVPASAPGSAPGAAAAPAPDARPTPTLDDVAALTHESDYARFVAPDVGGEVRNAALKKLFSDPHFNVMDGLDTYIDDYNTPDPLPAAMLRKMAQAAWLGLAEPEEQPPNAQEAPGDAPAAPLPAAAPAAAAQAPDDENPDLRLQSLHDPGPSGPEPGTGGDARGQC